MISIYKDIRIGYQRVPKESNMSFPKSYDDSKYAGRARKETCQGTDPKGKPCENKAVRGRNLCGHCIDRTAAQEQKTREAHHEEKK